MTGGTRPSWWRAHGVRMRLTAWYVVAMLLVLGVYVFGVYVVVSGSVRASLDQQLRRDFQWVAASVFRTEDGSFDWTEPEALVAEEGLPWVQVWSDDGGAVLFRNSEAARLRIPETQALASEADDRTVSVATADAPLRVLSRRGAIGPVNVVIQVARSEEVVQQELQDLRLFLVFGLPLAVAVAGLGGYVFAARVLAPIEQMTEQARTITAERLSDRLPVTSPDDEMGRLATVINQTLGRLEESFAQMRRFTADVSHELRTPLTAMRSVGEVGLRGHRDEAAYRAIVGSMLEEVDRLTGLVDRLLTLSRAETDPAAVSREAVDLSALVEGVVSNLGVLAEEKQQTLSIERQASPVARGDGVVLRQVVTNLVDNAIKFTPVGGRVVVRLSEQAGLPTLDVSDDGPGVPEEARDRIFDRFYRREDTGVLGAGLGLSLARGGMEAMGGRLTLERAGPDGCTFRVTLPPAGRVAASDTPALRGGKHGKAAGF